MIVGVISDGVMDDVGRNNKLSNSSVETNRAIASDSLKVPSQIIFVEELNGCLLDLIDGNISDSDANASNKQEKSNRILHGHPLYAVLFIGNIKYHGSF